VAPTIDAVIRGTVQPGSDTLGQYMGLSKGGGAIARRNIKPGELIGVYRLTVIDIAPTADGEWTQPMQAGTFTPPSSDAGRYGWRIHPTRGTLDFHNGVDLGAAAGTPVYSVANGKVIMAKYDDCWGNIVLIDHGGYISLYAHLTAFASGTYVGATVGVGDQIGASGATGACVAGAHLHFGIGTSLDILRGEEVGSVEPEAFMRERGAQLFEGSR
jgi:murein DD-endopeptidase MepM/ murein hydrolase activator NlpD